MCFIQNGMKSKDIAAREGHIKRGIIHEEAAQSENLPVHNPPPHDEIQFFLL
jgi:hypothetical protein